MAYPVAAAIRSGQLLEEPPALVDFCTTGTAKIPIIGAPLGVCEVKNRLTGDFWRVYARSATNSEAENKNAALQGTCGIRRMFCTTLS
jgi:hypothetical protein